MNRVVEIKLGERSWPMCLTLHVFTEICERYGSMESCMKRLDEAAGIRAKDKEPREMNIAALIEENTWLLERMLLGAWTRAGFTPDGDTPRPPTQSQIMNMISPGDFLEVQLKVFDAIRLGQSREVGAEAPKNAGGASDG